MATIGQNVVQIVIQGKDETGTASRNASSNLQKLAKLGAAAAATLATIGVAAGTGLIALTRNAINAADEIGKLAQKAGTTTEFMSAMAHAADLNEVSTEALKRGFKELNEEIAKGSEVFRNVGIATRDSAGNLKTVEQMLPEIADKFADMADGARKSELATKLFGKAGIDMIPMLNQGAAGLKAATEEARRFGLIVDEKAAKEADEFNDNLARLGAMMRGIGMQVAKDILPQLVAWTDAIIKLEEQHGFLKAIIDAVSTSIGVAAVAVENFSTLLYAWGEINKAFLKASPLTAALMGIKGGADSATGSVEHLQNAMKGVGGMLNTWIAKQLIPDASVNVPGNQPKGDGGDNIVASQYFKMLEEMETAQLEFGEREKAIEEQRHAERLRKIEEISAVHGDALLLREEAEKLHSLNLEQIERREAERKRMMHVKVANGIAQTFGDIASAAAAFGKKGFKAWKAFATAQAIVNTYSSAVGAYNAMASIPYVGPALGVAAAAAAVAAGLANVAQIQATEPAGAAHGGLTSVPAESTWLLQKGERVLSPNQNEDLTDALNGGGLGGVMHVTINMDGSVLARGIGELSRDGRLEIDAKAIIS